MSEQTIADRLRSLVPERQKAESARKCGMATNTFTSYLEGSEPTASKLVQLARGLGVSVQWLVTGEEPAQMSQSQTQVGSVPKSDDDMIEVPYLDVLASAGPGAGGAKEEVVDVVRFHRTFLRSLGVPTQAARIVTVSGDSMEPTLLNGDLILVDTSVDRIGGEAIYVIVLDGETYVKRAQRRMNKSILVSSDNERYPADEFKPGTEPDFNIAGRVVWFGRSI